LGGAQGRVQVWVRAVFHRHGHHVIEVAVVDTCAAIAVNLVAAHGPETFAGFAYGFS